MFLGTVRIDDYIVYNDGFTARFIHTPTGNSFELPAKVVDEAANYGYTPRPPIGAEPKEEFKTPMDRAVGR